MYIYKKNIFIIYKAGETKSGNTTFNGKTGGHMY